MFKKKYLTLLWYTGFACLILFTFSCKKEDLTNNTDNIQWMRVLEDTLTYSTDDANYLGRNGKVVTGSDDNIYVYYYSKDHDQTVLRKYDPEGAPVWKKTFDNCKPLDIARLNDGNILLAVSISNQVPNFLTLYSIQSNGDFETRSDTIKNFIWSCAEILNTTIYPTEGSSFVISGVWNSYIGGANFSGTSNEVFIVKHSQLHVQDWSQYLGFCFGCPYAVSWPSGDRNGSSVTKTSNSQYLFQFSTYSDGSTGPAESNTLTGILDADGNADTSFIYNAGVYNRYGNGFIRDFNGDYINYYSSPKVGGNTSQSVPAGFLRIGQDAQIKDTIPISIPNDYRITSCTRSASGFMLTAYKAGVANGANDYSAAHTLFLRGGSDWQTTDKFYFQQFYSDYFFSSSPTLDDGFISMGRIQSFNGPNNKLVLVKWKN